MAVRRLAEEQPESFAFTAENAAWAKQTIAKFPKGRQASAVIPLMWRAQEQEGWVTKPAIETIGRMLDMPFIRVLEVATFYTMFHLAPVGKKAHVQVCGTTPCMLRGAEDLKDVCRKRIHHEPHHLSEDGDFSWEEVECLGACVNAPMVQIFADTYEDLTPESFEKILDAFARGRQPKPGPQIKRTKSAPAGGLTSLKDKPAKAKANPAAPKPEPAAEEKSQAETAVVPQAKPEPTAEPAPAPTAESAPAPAALASIPPAGEGGKPGLYDDRPEDADNLKEISGVGPKLEATLNEMGIYRFAQIAAWNADNIAWVDERLKFKGRIERDDWVAQAKILAEGGETEFSRRVEKGEVPSSAGGDETKR
ncbi:MAG TPA: NADH-quinone oxidoreductase subunit NuoE [Afifellaceae bacterium]|nr:NADH-quinone oxidoreductase subunit NuoE [Afifellaceae bacterium]